MARGLTLLPVFLLLATTPGFSQIIIPGVGFPGGGGYPGSRRRQQQDPSQQSRQSNATTLIGMLRKIEDKDVIIEDDDKMITTVSIAGSTKYTGTSGGKSQIGDFQPGDRVSISANQDSKNVYHAESMSMVRVGTADEHSAASLAADDPSHPLGLNSSGSSSNSSSGNSANSSSNTSSGNNNHPVLRRASSSDDTISSNSSSGNSSSSSSSSDNDPDRPRLRRASSSSDDTSSSANNSSGNSSSSSSSSSSDSPPRLRRAVSGADDATKAEIAPGDSSSTSSSTSSSSASVRPRPAPADSDSDRPLLRRAPQADPNNTVAEARPSLHADDVNGVTRMPSGPQVGPPDDNYSHVPQRVASGDEFIDDAREAAFSFSETLPNYVVKQYTTRYATAVARGGRTSWQALDSVTADVLEVDGTEQYKNILVNGKPPVRDVEKTGSWSRGEFSSLQLDVLSPLTNADFHGKRATTIVNRPAFRYDFSVEQPNSHWHVESEGQSYLPAYTGSIWIDKESHRTLRIELSAQNMPRNFPLDQVESAVDYDFVVIGDGKYLLPVHSEALSCGRGVGCSRNVIEFRNYKKFTADTSITFDPDAK